MVFQNKLQKINFTNTLLQDLAVFPGCFVPEFSPGHLRSLMGEVELTGYLINNGQIMCCASLRLSAPGFDGDPEGCNGCFPVIDFHHPGPFCHIWVSPGPFVILSFGTYPKWSDPFPVNAAGDVSRFFQCTVGIEGIQNERTRIIAGDLSIFSNPVI